jgi:hypothetical protein
MWQAGSYRKATLGRSDDVIKATLAGAEAAPVVDGVKVLDFRQAQARAQEWARRLHRVALGLEPEAAASSATPYTVADAVADYLADYAARGGKGLYATKCAADAHILPQLGKLPVGRLTRDRLKGWHRALAASPGRLRAKEGQERHRDTAGDPDAPRRRRSSANRVLTILKAALNHGRSEGKVLCCARRMPGRP